MNYNELAKSVHENAVSKGFWDKEQSVEHYLMLVLTELSEAVEADRKGRYSCIPAFEEKLIEQHTEADETEVFVSVFSSQLKDTVGDELADVAIRLLDLEGYLQHGLDGELTVTRDNDEKTLWENMQARDIFSPDDTFTEDCLLLAKTIMNAAQTRSVVWSLYGLYRLARKYGIDIAKHVELKMRYNATRPKLHGKKYSIMRVKELIEKLQTIEEEYGNLLVSPYNESKEREMSIIRVGAMQNLDTNEYDVDIALLEEGEVENKKSFDNNVSSPKHYTSHPSGIECIKVVRHYCFSIGNAIKYLWRAGLKQEKGMSNIDKEIEDLQKAIWYINDRIEMLKKQK